MSEPISLEEIEIHLSAIDKRIDDIDRKFSSIQRTLDSIYEDRELIVDIQNDLTDVKKGVVAVDKHNEALTENIKDTLDLKSREIQYAVVDSGKKVSKDIVHRIIMNISALFINKNPNIEKKSLLNRLTSIFKRSTTIL